MQCAKAARQPPVFANRNTTPIGQSGKFFASNFEKPEPNGAGGFRKTEQES
jgi:hypothetical protein